MAVGFSKGKKLPDVVLKPPPLFPDTDYKPVPLKTGEECPILLKHPHEERQDIKRYSKRYVKVYKEEWIPDWRRLPREMMPRNKCKKAGPKPKKAKDTGKGTSLTNTADVFKKIEELEKREEKEGSKEKSREGDDDDDNDAAEQEGYDEEEQEEGNDYINSYFEDGDDFGADSDDNMDEAT
uniref:Uncharacterized protein n=1 Tax=Pan troglodytes TaxID=9598 RepID=A0A2I3RBN5_PANTR